MVPFNFYQVLIVSLIFLFLVQCSNINNPNYEMHQNNVAFNTWLNNYKKKAQQDLNVSKVFLDKIFADVQYNKTVINLDSQQPEFVLTLDSYLKNFLTEDIFNKGNLFLKNHWEDLKKASNLYDIPPYIIVAFLGIETRYGALKPKYKALEAIANLAFNPRRSAFFTKELNALVILINKGYVDIDVKSSWAGALGYPQFMPSTYLNYSVDGSGNGKVDLISNYKDIFVSVANFLRALGWNYYREWGYEVLLPDNFNYDLIKNKTKYTIYQWRNLGVKRSCNKEFDDISALSRIITLDNKSYLVTSNFDVIMKWNKSVLFAITVGLLSDELKKYTDAIINQEKEKEKSLSFTNSKKLKNTKREIAKKQKLLKSTKKLSDSRITNKKPASDKITKPNNNLKIPTSSNELQPTTKNSNEINSSDNLTDNIFNKKMRIFSGEGIN